MTTNAQRMKAKEATLTAKQLRAELYFDYATGIFYTNRSELTVSVGHLTKEGYVSVRAGGMSFQAHRLAWLYDKGRWPEGQIDHIDRNRANNRVENLREGDQTFNMGNQGRAHKGSKSGLLGAYFNVAKNNWYAQIRVNKVLHHLGTFSSAEEAHSAYLVEKRKVHKSCTI